MLQKHNVVELFGLPTSTITMVIGNICWMLTLLHLEVPKNKPLVDIIDLLLSGSRCFSSSFHDFRLLDYYAQTYAGMNGRTWVSVAQIVIIGLCSTEYHEHLHEGESLQRSLFSMTEARWWKSRRLQNHEAIFEKKVRLTSTHNTRPLLASHWVMLLLIILPLALLSVAYKQFPDRTKQWASIQRIGYYGADQSLR